LRRKIVAQLGELLRAAREEQGLSLDQVEQSLRIRYYLLEALEAENFDLFPSPVVTRGLIRNYARYLGLDPIEALTRYDGNGILPVKGQRLTPNGIEFMNLSMAPRPFITWDLVIGIFLFLVVVGGSVYFVYGTSFELGLLPTPAPPALESGPVADSALPLPTVTPLPTATLTPLPPTDTPTPVIYAGVTIELVISQPSWIQILVDDVKAFEGILQPGERREWSGQRRVAIRAGNAGGVEVIVNGQSRGLMGEVGRVADQVWEKIDDPTLLTPQPDSSGQTDVEAPVTPASTGADQAALDTPVDGSSPPLESAPEAQPASDNQ
jgi:hypothetical protein